MTPQAQRIAIAEACGWKLMHCRFHNAETWHSPHGICAEGNAETVLPDYLSDLNAMHDAETGLTDEQHREYRGALLEVCGSLADALCATATQRAEAFLRTLHLWDDTK